jgi:hypothetical protein
MTINGIPYSPGFDPFAIPPTTDALERFADNSVGACSDPAPSTELCVDVVQPFDLVVGPYVYPILTMATRRDCVQVLLVSVPTSMTITICTVN